MADARPSCLVIGYGNPGRLDDGLGPALAARLAAAAPAGCKVDANYQLFVEDAVELAAHDVVVFVDAATAGPEPFGFTAVVPTEELGFTTHSLQPEALLGAAQRLLDARTRGYVLAIRGYEFDAFGERLSAAALANLEAALAFLRERISRGDYDEMTDDGGQGR